MRSRINLVIVCMCVVVSTGLETNIQNHLSCNSTEMTFFMSITPCSMVYLVNGEHGAWMQMVTGEFFINHTQY